MNTTFALTAHYRRLMLLLPLALTGCHSRLTERHAFIARDAATGQISVVRVQIEAKAQVADLEFRAGYVQSTAIDEVVRGNFDHIFKPMQRQQSAIDQAQRHAVDQAVADLRQAYELPWAVGRAKVQDAEDKLLEARSLVNRSDDRATREKPEAPEEKFVIAVAANPDAVFNAFAASTNQQNQQQNLIGSVTRLRRQAELQSSLRDDAARQLWPAKPEVPKEPAALAAALATYGDQLNDFLVAAP